jgi:hypothetical protein
VDSTTVCSLGNQSLSNAAVLGGASNFLGVPKSDSPGLLAVPSGHCGKLKKFMFTLIFILHHPWRLWRKKIFEFPIWYAKEWLLTTVFCITKNRAVVPYKWYLKICLKMRGTSNQPYQACLFVYLVPLVPTSRLFFIITCSHHPISITSLHRISHVVSFVCVV